MSVILPTQSMDKYILFHQANDADANPISLQNYELFEMFRNARSGRIDNITQNPRLSNMSVAAPCCVYLQYVAHKGTILQ